MDHIAILDKKRKLIPKILSGKKKIETRWYMTRRAPWDKIHAGDTVYFKDAGCAVTAKAEVAKVLQFTEGFKEVVDKYADRISFTNPKEKVYDYVKDKNYCILVFLKNPTEIEPFDIDKTGYGNACAWMCVGNIKSISK